MLDFIFNPINKVLDGKKTVLGLIGATATLVLVIVDALKDGLSSGDVQVLVGAVSAWLVAVGLGHKASKIENLLKK